MEKTEKVKSFEDVCSAAGVTESEIIPYAEPKDGVQKSINAYAKLIFLAKVLNEGWEPNWDDYDEDKYFPWFYMKSTAAGGPGFSYDVYVYDDSCSAVGARLAYKTAELAEYAGTQFLEIYKEYMVIG